MSQTLIETLTDEHIVTINKLIIDQLQSPVDLVNQVCAHLIINGGKRFRPRLTLLIAQMLEDGAMSNLDVQRTAASLEIIHTSTLLHDDVIDVSTMRRGNPSAISIYGNSIAVLGGDYLFTRAFILCQGISENVTDKLIECLAILVQGEIDQLSNIADVKLTKEQYFKTIYAKTSILFEVASIIPALLFKKPQEIIDNLKVYGRSLGNAFQIQDDILDYTSDAETLGKNIGDDLQEEKITLPLIYAFEHLNDAKKDELTTAIKNCNIDKVLSLVYEANAIPLTQKRAQQEVDKAVDALSIFPDSKAKTALIELAKLSISRNN